MSNALDIVVTPEVSPPPSIVSVKLTSSVSKAKTNTPITFYVDVVFGRSITEQDTLNYGVMVKVYVDGSLVKTLTYSLQEGGSKWSGSFTLKFSKPGTYKVQVDATLYRKSVAQPT